MSRLLSSTQTNPISYRRVKRREIQHFPVPPPAFSPLCSGAERTKKTFQDPADDWRCCFSRIPPIWGAKRARSALLLNPIRGAKRARRASLLLDPIWGAKRAKRARGASFLLDPIWRAKRARSARTWRDWANLGDGPAGVIAELLLANDVADLVSFRAVCRPWRLCSMDPHAHGILDRRFHPRQWIMLRGTLWATGGSPYCLGFLNESTGCSRYLQLPELHGHEVFGPTTEGLLVLLDRNTYLVRLLNPFTRQAAKLPSITTLMSERDMMLVKDRGLLSVSGAGLADDSTIAVHFNEIRTLAIIKPGDTDWTVVDRGTQFLPAVSFAGRFYCATNRAVMVVETSADQPPRLAIAANLIRPFYRIMMDSVHLVDNGGELMLVDRKCDGNSEREYKVYRVDLDAREMVPVRGLGGRAVFIGRELACSVSPLVFPYINADSIYLGFENSMTGIVDNSPIHLMDGTSSPRQFENSIEEGIPLHGPLGIDDYLSWCVIGCHINPLKDT